MKKIIAIGIVILLTGLLSGCIENTVSTVNPIIQVRCDNSIYEFNYSSDGLRDAIDTCELCVGEYKTLHIPVGNLIVYGNHSDSVFSFYFHNLSNLYIFTDGLDKTRFIVFDDNPVFGFSNISKCRFVDLNITIINDMPTVIDMHDTNGTMSTMNIFDGLSIFHNENVSKFWYDEIQNKTMLL